MADVYLTQFFLSSSIVGTPTGITNFSHAKVADDEIIGAKTEVDSKKQLALWAAAHGLTSFFIVRPDFPWVAKDVLIDTLFDILINGLKR